MGKYVLVLENEQDRQRTIKTVIVEGGKIIHDSGGRVIVVDVESAESVRNKLSPNTLLLPSEEDVSTRLSNPSPTESIFIQALNVRRSNKYRQAKKLRKPPGEDPLEKQLLSGSCTEMRF